MLRLVVLIPIANTSYLPYRPNQRNSSKKRTVILFDKYKYSPIKDVLAGVIVIFLKAVKWLRWLILCLAKLHTIYKHCWVGEII